MLKDNTQDPDENEQQLARVKEWISSRHLDTLELTDVLSNFPDISIVMSCSSLFSPSKVYLSSCIFYFLKSKSLFLSFQVLSEGKSNA